MVVLYISIRPRYIWGPINGSDLVVLMSVTHRPFADLTDVTLADKDNYSIPTGDVNRTILGNMWQCK